MASDAAPGVKVQNDEALGVRVEIGRLGDMSTPIIGSVLWGFAQAHSIGYGALAQGDNTPFGRVLVSWFWRFKPLEELWLIHDIPFAVPPLQTGLLLVCDIPRRKRGRFLLSGGNIAATAAERKASPGSGERLNQ